MDFVISEYTYFNLPELVGIWPFRFFSYLTNKTFDLCFLSFDLAILLSYSECVNMDCEIGCCLTVRDFSPTGV